MQLNNNVSFKAVPGGQIKSLLAKNPEKLNEIRIVLLIFFTPLYELRITETLKSFHSDYLTKYSEPVTTLLLWKKKHHSLLKIYSRS